MQSQHEAYAHGDAGAVTRLNACMAAGPTEYEMRACIACGLEFACPAHAPSPDWYGELYGQLALYPGERWEFRATCAAMAPTDRVVDIGCGDGRFLRAVQGRVAAVTGIDFAPASVKRGVESGLDIRVLSLATEAPDVRGLPAANHITAFHVLEHLANPGRLFDLASALAAPGASLWIAVPSDRRGSRVFGEVEVLDAPPHHLTRWTPESLRAIGPRNGWQCHEVRYEPLPFRARAWEAAHRSAFVNRLDLGSPAATRFARRAAGLGSWLWHRRRLRQATGYSMLARYGRQPA